MDNTEIAQDVNPLLERIKMPGETFTLPSLGLFYTHGELDESVKNGEIHVHPMTAIDEIVMRTPDMIFSGRAITEVFNRCIPQINDVSKLSAKDVDFLLICLRKVSYGDELRVPYTHNCENAKEHTYSVDVNDFIRNTKRIDPTTSKDKFSVKLDNGQIVHTKPITYESFVAMMQIDETESDPQKLKEIFINSLANVIEAVDEVTNQEHIKGWLNSVKPLVLKDINKHVESTMRWGSDFRTKVKCKDCGNEIDITAPMNPLYFFT